jgi:hypothetical protein
LGQVIRLTEGHRAVVEDKPEVKKAGGVKYTPVYIVENIVGNTLGPILKSKTPIEVVLISVLDPACGSGSFLIVAYQYLLDWHRDWYVQNLVPLLQNGLKPSSPEITRLLPGIETGKKGRKKEPELPIYQGRGGEWRLTTAERKRILLNNIYGVDIDRQAVEVTKLSLLLKVLEGENEETISKQLKLFQERALPDLSNNIKCGNSLIGWDILKDKPGLTQEEIDRINPFDWEMEFSKVMRTGGFHAIIGNPPYIRIQVMKEWASVDVEYYKQKYVSAIKGNYDIYVVFVEKGLSLLNEHGRLGFIVPNKFFNAKYGQPLRELIESGKNLSEIVHFGDQQVFDGVMTYTCLLFLNKTRSMSISFSKVSDLGKWQNTGEATKNLINIESIDGTEWNFDVGDTALLFKKLKLHTIKLNNIADRIFQGLVTGADSVFILKNTNDGQFFSEATQKNYSLEKELMHPLCKGSINIRRYFVNELTKSILFPYKIVGGNAILLSERELSESYPQTYQYLLDCRKILESREHGKWKHDRWYALGRSQNLNQMEQTKILTPSIAKSASFTLDTNEFYYFVGSGGGGGGGYGITLKKIHPDESKYVLGLLNSRLLDGYLKLISSRFSGGFYAYNRQYIERLPIRVVDFSDPVDAARHDRMVSLVDQMLTLHKQLHEVRTPHEQTGLQRQIEATDHQIDALVYELYDLTEEEIRIVEGGE